MNLLQRLFGKKRKPVPQQPVRKSAIPMPRGTSGHSLGNSTNTEEDDYYRRRQMESFNNGYVMPDYTPPPVDNTPSSDFGGFGGGDTGGGGVSGSWDSGSSDSGGSYDSGSSDSGSLDSGGGDSGGSSD